MQQWINEEQGVFAEHIATQAARWGADQELEACCEWIYKLMDRGLEWSMDLRAARRPKPPSLKERALQAWAAVEAGVEGQVLADSCFQVIHADACHVLQCWG